jgi:cytochrome oxidase Cu insertion factor (SCO1/SenC/PrrC family)
MLAAAVSVLDSVSAFTVSPFSARSSPRAHVSMETLADFSANTIDGKEVDLSTFKGKPTLILNVASL